MIGPTTAPTRAAAAVLLSLSIALGGPLGGAALAAEGTISYVHESEAAFAKQLAGKEVKAVTVNKRLRTMRVTLADGRHVLASYPKQQEPQTVSRLHARGVTVTMLSKGAAEKEAKPASHHKIRYIVGGVLIVVIVIAGAVLLVNRRRSRD